MPDRIVKVQETALQSDESTSLYIYYKETSVDLIQTLEELAGTNYLADPSAFKSMVDVVVELDSIAKTINDRLELIEGRLDALETP